MLVGGHSVMLAGSLVHDHAEPRSGAFLDGGVSPLPLLLAAARPSVRPGDK